MLRASALLKQAQKAEDQSRRSLWIELMANTTRDMADLSLDEKKFPEKDSLQRQGTWARTLFGDATDDIVRLEFVLAAPEPAKPSTTGVLKIPAALAPGTAKEAPVQNDPQSKPMDKIKFACEFTKCPHDTIDWKLLASFVALSEPFPKNLTWEVLIAHLALVSQLSSASKRSVKNPVFESMVLCYAEAQNLPADIKASFMPAAFKAKLAECQYDLHAVREAADTFELLDDREELLPQIVKCVDKIWRLKTVGPRWAVSLKERLVTKKTMNGQKDVVRTQREREVSEGQRQI